MSKSYENKPTGKKVNIPNPYKHAKEGEFYIPEEWEDNESDVE